MTAWTRNEALDRVALAWTSAYREFGKLGQIGELAQPLCHSAFGALERSDDCQIKRTWAYASWDAPLDPGEIAAKSGLYFLEVVVAFPAVQAEGHGEALRRLADRLCAEFPAAPSDGPPGEPSDTRESLLSGRLGVDDEQLVAMLREALAYVAGSLGTSDGEPALRLLDITLDGAEFVIRSELEKGDHESVLRMMPSFVFLVALAVTDRDRALAASDRTTELIDSRP